jgi:hypothetical protein
MSEMDRFLTGKSQVLAVLAVSELSAAFAVMGLFKQLMIFGKTGLQGLPTRVTLSLWVFSRQGATRVPLHKMSQNPYLETFRAGADPGIICRHQPESVQLLAGGLEDASFSRDKLLRLPAGVREERQRLVRAVSGRLLLHGRRRPGQCLHA